MAEPAKKPNYKVTDEVFEDLVHRYTNDLNARVRAGRVDPVVGRDQEVDQIITIILHKGRSNVVLLGGAGVGKTAVFSAVAQFLEAKQNVPRLLEGARVLELDFALVGAGTESRGDFEGRLVPLIKGIGERNESKLQPQIILCIDELHTIMRTCHASSASGVADLMKPFLTQGNLQIIGATTDMEYDEYVRLDPAMDRRFQKIYLRQPDVPETIKVLLGIRKAYEKHFGLTVTDEACEKIVKLTTKYVKNRNNPDKSIMTLDGACARFVKANKTGELDHQSIIEALAAELSITPAAII